MPLPYSLNPLGVKSGPGFFEFTVVTPRANITIGQGNTNTLKDWGDGTVNSASSHTYASPGTYLVRETGNLTPSQRFYCWTTPEYVIDCNWNWKAVGHPGLLTTQYQTGTAYTGRPVPSLPESLIGDSSQSVLASPSTIPAYITRLPAGMRYLNSLGNSQGLACWQINTLPAGIVDLFRAFRYPGGYGLYRTFIDIEKIIQNCPASGFADLTRITSFCNNCLGISGTAAAFMQKCPSVTTVKAANGTETAFYGSYIDLFGPEDHLEVTITLQSGGTWGFTPTSSAALWYMVNWGDDSDEIKATANVGNHLATFTSGTRIEHTSTSGGTYTIKLAMKAETLSLDAYSSTNGMWWAVGSPTIV